MAEALVKGRRSSSMGRTESLSSDTDMQRLAREDSGGNQDKADVNA